MSKSFQIAKRRFEIVGHTIARPKQLPVGHFADMYNVDDITIKRDLNALRKKGIDIHSVNNEGLYIRNPENINPLRSLIPEYVGISYSITPYHTATDFLLKQKGIEAVKILTIIQNAIEANKPIYIKQNSPSREFVTLPVNIYQNEQQWYLITKNKDHFRVIEIAKISEIEIAEPGRKLYSSSFSFSEDLVSYCLILDRDLSFRKATKIDKEFIEENFLEYNAKDILRDDKIDEMIDIKIDQMLDYLRSQVQQDYEKMIQKVLDRFRGDDQDKKEVSIPELLDVIKKFLS